MRGIKNPNVDIKICGNDVVVADGKTEYFRKLKSRQTVAIANDIYFAEKKDRKRTRLNSSHLQESRMTYSA